MNTSNYTYIIMGVSGCGKSTIASKLAHKMNAAILDGDFLHPKSNIKKMSQGNPLNDEDRFPWLQSINDAIFAMQRTNKYSFVVCSALKQQYRQIIQDGLDNVVFIYLQGDYSLVLERIQQRVGHFQKPQMLISQFETLEEPLNEENALIVNIDQTIDDIVDFIISKIS